MFASSAKENPRDQESRQDEEDVDANIPTPNRAHAGMIEDNEQDGNGAEALKIVAVSVDDKREDMERFVKTANVSFAVVRDAGQKLVAAADVSTMPTSFLIDRAGKIRCVHRGFAGDGTVKQYQEEIQQLLKEPAP